MSQQTCFVVMGFGKKTDFETGRTLDLDKSYQHLIKPAVEAAGLTCIRADEIVHSGLIDVPMYEQLFGAGVVVADLSTSNKNAFYELGIRHALKPYTTIVISEDGAKSFPFDVNHVAIQKYHHLGEDIGFSEVMRFRNQLTEAIEKILQKEPREQDSPVYTFLKNLKPPGLAEAVRSAIETSSRSVADTIESKVPSTSETGPSHREQMQGVEKARQRGDFKEAIRLLTAIRTEMQASKRTKPEDPPVPEDPYIIQHLALLTYKSKLPTPEEALRKALDLLVTLDPQTSNDTETLGIWGAVNKQLYHLTQKPDYLSESIRAYERGFYLRNDYYNGINLAFLYNVRASGATNRAEAITDFIQAQRIRREVLTICDQWLNENPVPTEPNADLMQAYRESRYWVLATKAEALIGLGEAEVGQGELGEAYEVAPEGWMKTSTEEQIGKLETLLADSPLKYIQNSA